MSDSVGGLRGGEGRFGNKEPYGSTLQLAVNPIPATTGGVAPSAVNVNAAMNPAVVPPTNQAACPPGGAGATTGTPPVTAGGSSVAAADSCVIASSSSSSAQDNTGTIVAAAIGGLIGLITLTAMVQKYKIMGSYSSFWGRILGLFAGAGAVGAGYMDFSSYNANDCVNMFGDEFMSSPCPCYVCVFMLWGFGALQLVFNLPFIYANEKTISKMYASFGLFSQAGLMALLSAGFAAGIKYCSGSLTGMLICCVGIIEAVMFLLGWFKGEDGMLSRMFQSAKDMLGDAANAANLLVDDGLKMFGLNADERSKVGLHNVYNFCRVVRGPDWAAGEEDGNGAGEIIGYIGENGVADGVAVSTGRQGWAKVKWEASSKTAEYRIGADNKFELKFADSEETEGVVGKLMTQTWSMFGYDPNADEKRRAKSEKKQIEFTLTSRLVGEGEAEGAAEGPAAGDDSDDEKSTKSGKPAATTVSADPTALVMTCEVYDGSSGRLIDRCDDVKPSLFRSAIRHRQLAHKQDAIVVELQKLPPDATLLLLWAKVPEGSKLGKWDRMWLRATSTGKDIGSLSLPVQEGVQSIAAHRGSQGFLMLALYTPQGGEGALWYAAKPGVSLGSGGVAASLAAEATKFLAAREKPEKSATKKKKKDAEVVDQGSKNVTDLKPISEVFENIKLELRCEAQAREVMSAKLDAVSAALAARLRAQNIPNPDIQAKKLALIQINKQHQLIYQKTLVVRRAYYLKMRMHPVQAMALAKKDANRAALYDGKEAEVRQAVLNSIAEEKAAVEEQKRQQEAEYANTYAGQASAALGAVWGWGGGESAEPKKKKKKKKKDDSAVEETAPVAPAAGLPPQFANLTPEQIAMLRERQRQQMAAKQGNV